MADKSRPKSDDPLDEDLELLKQDDLDEADASKEEPPPSEIEPMPIVNDPLRDDLPDEVEPAPSVLDTDRSLLSDEDSVASLDAIDEVEPPGDDLSWAEDEEAEPLSEASLPDETPTTPSQDWIDEVEPDGGISEAEWAGLEDERLLIVGFEERIDLPALGLQQIVAQLSTAQQTSTLQMPRSEMFRSEMFREGAVPTEVRLGGLIWTVSIVVAFGDGPASVILGRDALAGRVVVDPGKRLVLGNTNHRDNGPTSHG
ncbi:MAG: hypothetical protein AAFV53_17285 [Myxococcota bacterium]